MTYLRNYNRSKAMFEKGIECMEVFGALENAIQGKVSPNTSELIEIGIRKQYFDYKKLDLIQSKGFQRKYI